MSAPDKAEFDKHAAGYDGGLDNPIKRLIGSSPDDYIAVKARWLLRREKALRAGRDVLFDIDWQGTQQMREKARSDLVSVFLLPPSAPELERRLHTRAQDSTQQTRGAGLRGDRRVLGFRDLAQARRDRISLRPGVR